MSASSHPPGSASEVLATTTTTTTDDGAPGHRRAPSAPSIPTSYDFMDDSERAPPNPGPGAYSLAGDMNHRVGTGSIGVKGYGPLVSGAARLRPPTRAASAAPVPARTPRTSTGRSRRRGWTFILRAHPSAPFARATRAGVSFERADEDETPVPRTTPRARSPRVGDPGQGDLGQRRATATGGRQSESRSSAPRRGRTTTTPRRRGWARGNPASAPPPRSARGRQRRWRRPRGDTASSRTASRFRGRRRRSSPRARRSSLASSANWSANFANFAARVARGKKGGGRRRC